MLWAVVELLADESAIPDEFRDHEPGLKPGVAVRSDCRAKARRDCPRSVGNVRLREDHLYFVDVPP